MPVGSEQTSFDAVHHLDSGRNPPEKEFQSLFWVPMLYQTAETASALIESMLDSIEQFHDGSFREGSRKSILSARELKEQSGPKKRRQQILGDDSLGNEVIATRVEVVTKSDDTIFTLLSVLKQHFLFSKLHDYELQDVVDTMVDEYFEIGDDIMCEGDQGDKFYILERGSVDVIVGDMVVGKLSQGSSFGDLALMYNSPRAATIRSTSDCTCWSLAKAFFRQAMVTSSSNQTGNLAAFLGKLKLFETLNMETLSQLAKSLTLKTYADQEYIITQGEIGEHFFVIYKGKVRITKTGDDGREIPLLTLNEGNVFGERALIKKEPRAANVIASGTAECYSLAKDDFASMLGGIVEQMNELNTVRILRSAATFSELTDRSLNVVRLQMKKHEMFNGQRLLLDSQHLYVVLDGVLGAPDGVLYKVGSAVGSLATPADAEAASIVCKSDEAVVAIFARQSIIDQLLAQTNGAFNDDDHHDESGRQAVDPETQALQQLQMHFDLRKESAKQRVKGTKDYANSDLLSLEIIRNIGKGTFGIVYLARNKTTGKKLALKCLDKAVLVKASQGLYVKRECECLHNISHPFISQYYGVIVTPRKVLFSMEYVSGGELWAYLYEAQSGRGPYGGLTMPLVVNYAAMITLALEHIHGLGYCYRDLKSENIMLDQKGYVKLVDFGFAKSVPYFNKAHEVQYRTFTMCGTPDYMAPEVVLTQGHDKSADYWAFGVLTYEMLCGATPFESPTQKRIFEKIVNSHKFLNFPNSFDPHMKSFIRRLMHPKAALRIGALQRGFQDIKEHAIFTANADRGKLDWSKILSFETAMDYVPPMKKDDEIAPAIRDEDKTAQQMQDDFDKGLSANALDMIDLAFEMTVEDDINESLFQDLTDTEQLSMIG